jgi:hypothetical protein
VSTSLDDPFIYELLLEFGSDGYLVFFGTLEIYSREFSPEKEWKLDVKMKYFHKKFLISPKKIKKILEKISKWEVFFEDDRVSIFIPKFKELLDNYTRNEKINTNKLLASDSQETFQPIKNKEIRLKNKEKDNRGIFQIPTVQEISDYCQQRKNRINPEIFFNHYQSNGWMVGKNKMKDWKAAIITWEKKEGEYASNKGFGANTYRKPNNERQLDPNTAEELDRAVAEYERKTALREAGKIS